MTRSAASSRSGSPFWTSSRPTKRARCASGGTPIAARRQGAARSNGAGSTPLGITVSRSAARPTDVAAEPLARPRETQTEPADSRAVSRSSVRCQRFWRSATRRPPTHPGRPRPAAPPAAPPRWRGTGSSGPVAAPDGGRPAPAARPPATAAVRLDAQAVDLDPRRAQRLGQRPGPVRGRSPTAASGDGRAASPGPPAPARPRRRRGR